MNIQAIKERPMALDIATSSFSLTSQGPLMSLAPLELMWPLGDGASACIPYPSSSEPSSCGSDI
jgi:hypothetical protein